MLKGLYSFNDIIEDVKQETGITNLRNEYGNIRKLIARAEREINPYAGFLIRKKMIYYVGNGNFDGVKIKKPTDFVQLCKVGCCEDGICEGSYHETISHIVMCDNIVRDHITFTYWGLQCDGDGNPVTTYNHAEAVVAYIVWKLYSPKVFMGNGSQSLKRDYEESFNMRCGEARGEDFFPTESQLIKISRTFTMSRTELDEMICEDMCKSCECITTINDNSFMKNKMWWWQSPNINEILNESQITDQFLASKNEITLGEAISGFQYNYPYIGRIGFCIDNVLPDSVKIFDILGVDMVNSLNVFYQLETKRLIFIGKNYVSNSSIFFKLQYNGE